MGNPGKPEVPRIVTTEADPPSVEEQETPEVTLVRSPSLPAVPENVAELPQTPPRATVRRPSGASDPSRLSPPTEDLLRVPSNATTHSSPPSPGVDMLRVPSIGGGSSILSSSPSTPVTPPHSPRGYTVPPSPTLSHSSSVHFATSVDLRKNDPDAHSGAGSYAMLGSSKGRHHNRMPSTATMTSSGEGSAEGAEMDSHSPMTPVTNATLPDHRSFMTGDTRPSSRSGTATEPDRHENKPERKRPEALDASHEVADPAPFALPPVKLASLVDPKSLELLTEFGGVEGLAKGLGTHLTKGLSLEALGDAANAGEVTGEKKAERSGATDAMADRDPAFKAGLADRHRVYGRNTLPERKSKSLLLLMWLALKDKVLVILSIAAVVSLALGLYQDLGTPPTTYESSQCPGGTCTEPRVDWVEGVAIVVAILIVVLVGSLNDWQKERQFKKLNEKKEDRVVKVIRAGRERVINVKDVLVGDICLLEPGEILPVDGVFLRGHNVRCDESGATGESDAIRKFSYDECLEEKNSLAAGAKTKKDCFMISGSKVLEGVGEYVVISVGTRSFNGRIMMSLSGDSENTPLQLKLNNLAELIAKLGSLAGALLFAALMIKFFVQLKTESDRTANQKAMSFIQILIISVTLVVVAVPEGLPLAVTLALAFATKRMSRENLLVRVLSSCETMANASVVCTDKTGTLTTNVMSVVAGSVGVNCKFVRRLEENRDRSTINEGGAKPDRHNMDFAVDLSDMGTVVRGPLQKLFSDAINLNTTAFEDTDAETGKLEFVGSKTETALLRFVKDLGWDDYHAVREWALPRTVQVVPFSSERKAMGLVVQLSEGLYRFYVKGASEILTKQCSRHVVVSSPGHEATDREAEPSDGEVEVTDLTETSRQNIERTIIFYANQSLRTIAICYRDFESWPPAGVANSVKAKDEVPYQVLAQDLTLIAITGIEDPLREGVREAVEKCHMAGVSVKMCTGDNVLTARSIATQCGIYTAGGIIMEGPKFRKLNQFEMMQVVPRLQVLARSSPEDKKILVSKLRSLGEVVGVTGDGTNDGPALKTADVGFSMGITGTEVAKEASDIILMDDNFTSIVKAIMWGRCVNDAVRKFLQFQVTVNIVAVIVTFVTAVVSGTETSALTAVQLLWINIIMDTFAALALATDPATPELLNRKPDRRTAPLFSVDMSKMIAGQAAWQTLFVLVFHFAGNKIFGYNSSDLGVQNDNENELNTMIFNAFVFSQIFNAINCRRLDNKLNIFEHLFSNWYFLAITLIEIAVQILIVFVGGPAFQVTSMSGRDWGISILLGLVAFPLGVLIRMVPNAPVEWFMIKVRLMKDPSELPVQSPERDEQDWNPAINRVRDNLNTFANIRGGRMRGSSFVAKSRSAQLDEAGIKLPSLLAMVPTLVVSSVGAGWAPQRGSMSDPAGLDPSRSSAALFSEGIQVHPDTDKNDFAYRQWGQREAEA